MFCDIEIVEDGYLACVEFYNVGLVGRNHCNIVFHFVEDGLVVNIYVFICGVEQVPYQGNGTSSLFEYELGALLCLLHFCQGLFPTFVENLHFGVKFCHSLSFCDGAHDDSAIFGPYAVDELFQSCPFFTALYLARHRYLVAKWHEYKITSGKTYLASETWSFGGDGLFDYLHQHFLSYLERVLHTPVLFEVGQPCRFGERV